jgi:hypothetical protein
VGLFSFKEARTRGVPTMGSGAYSPPVRKSYSARSWENEAAMRSYENGEILQATILPRLKPFFSGDYTTTRCEVRFAEEFDQ